MQNHGKIATKLHEIMKSLQNRRFSNDFKELQDFFYTGQF